MPATPYSTLPSKSFWRVAVAERDDAHYDGLWTPRFTCDSSTLFATAGSCFAQHISRWLKTNGYRWLEAETPPADMSPDTAKSAGYGVFSFRTGNIYTAALLKQWVQWALENEEMSPEVWRDGNRYHDPFRPTLPAGGHEDQVAVLAARRATLKSIRHALETMDVFIFTLGLTEGWVSRDGTVYPMCPGTVCGQFDDQQHQFVNYSTEEVAEDLRQTFDAIKAINPDARFLLTVSPVPLTATASQDHVLSATSYSKSVLRAAAGALKSERDDVDYFPSYELIASPAQRGRWFDKNMRTVTSEGVQFVMSHFAAGLEPSRTEETTRTPELRSAPPSDELVCEEVMLNEWSHRTAINPAGVHLCLVGDSHMGMLSKALNTLGVAHCGGMIMNGSAWFSSKLHLDPEEYFVPLENAVSRERWGATLRVLKGIPDSERSKTTIVLNLGLQTHVSVKAFLAWVHRKNGNYALSAADGINFFKQANASRLDLVSHLVTDGFKVLAVTDPATQHVAKTLGDILPAFEVYEIVAGHVLRELGCKVFNAREHFGNTWLTPNYLSHGKMRNGEPDWIHGNDDYYLALAQAICRAHSIPCQMQETTTALLSSLSKETASTLEYVG